MAAAPPDRHPTVDGFRRLLRQPRLPVLRAHRAVGTLPRPIEFVFNTPSHHRVHHGSDPDYLDRNYAGILIIWDRMFGTFKAEDHRPTYGLTKPVGTYNIWDLQTHEYRAIARDWRTAGTFRDKLGYAFGPPGWRRNRPTRRRPRTSVLLERDEEVDAARAVDRHESEVRRLHAVIGPGGGDAPRRHETLTRAQDVDVDGHGPFGAAQGDVPVAVTEPMLPSSGRDVRSTAR